MLPKSVSAAKALIERLSEFDRCIERIMPGSVTFSIMCPTLEALDDLHDELYTSGALTRMFTNAYITGDYCSVTVNVTIEEIEWQRCRTQLLSTGETLIEWI